MKRTSILTLLTIVITISVINTLEAQDSPRSRESFNLGWKFVKYFNASNDAVTTDKEPENLQLPTVNGLLRVLSMIHWRIIPGCCHGKG
jgi:hypothetical protein